MYALIDGNNFYVSCERVFNPKLIDRPVITLSNNDGCAISRSNEAKDLGIKMGAPWFEIRHLEKEAGLVGMSANFALYGDMSNRMMSVAAELGPSQEIYSIDESFIDLHGIRGNLTARANEIRTRILMYTGIPCGVGIGSTKTRAKLANHIAKTAERKPGSYPKELSKVCNLETLPPSDIDAILGATGIAEVWGVGRQIGKQLKALGVSTVLDLVRMPPSLVRQRWNVTLERTVRELQGESCISLEDAPPAKKEIAYTRSFGHPVTTLPPLIEAISEFTARTAEKARAQDSIAGQLLVFAHTSPFREGPSFSRHMTVNLVRPTSDTRLLVRAARDAITKIYQPGYQLIKAGVILMDLVPGAVKQGELGFGSDEPTDKPELMITMDALNQRFGRGTVSIGSAGVQSQHKIWTMKQERLSPRFTTHWDELPIVKAD